MIRIDRLLLQKKLKMKQIAIGCTVLLLLSFVDGSRIDVCKNNIGYVFYGHFPGCYFDPNVNAPATTIMTRFGYKPQEFKATTADGYILTIQRIPFGNNEHPQGSSGRARPAVLLIHTFGDSSAAFVMLKHDSLAFLLADSGYDVWLTNIRGTEYSLEHKNLTDKDEKYWDFSFDEVAKYDMDTTLTLIEKETGRRGTIVIAHGAGSTPILAYSATNPELSKQRITIAIILGPVTELHNTKLKMPIAKFIYSRYGSGIISVTEFLHLSRWLSYYKYQRDYMYINAAVLLNPIPYYKYVNMYGPNDQIGTEMKPYFINHHFAGGSYKVLIHFYQFTRGRFGKFNYGKTKNLKEYGFEEPPIYNISKIEHPVYLVYAEHDYLADKTDSILVYTALSDSARKYGRHEILKDKFNHLAFLYGKDAKELVYVNLLQLLGSITNNTQFLEVLKSTPPLQKDVESRVQELKAKKIPDNNLERSRNSGKDLKLQEEYNSKDKKNENNGDQLSRDVHRPIDSNTFAKGEALGVSDLVTGKRVVDTSSLTNGDLDKHEDDSKSVEDIYKPSNLPVKEFDKKKNDENKSWWSMWSSEDNSDEHKKNKGSSIEKLIRSQVVNADSLEVPDNKKQNGKESKPKNNVQESSEEDSGSSSKENKSEQKKN